MDEYQLQINGEAVESEQRFDVLNPANGKLIGRAPHASKQQLEQALNAAQRAFQSWSQQSDAERQSICEQIAAKIEEHAEQLATLLTLEQGKPLNGLGSRWELGGAAAWAAHTASLSLPVKTLQDNDDGKVELHRKPLGVVASITPWNFPVLIAVWHVLPALRTGNTVVIKPSPKTPLATIRLVEIMNTVLPKGVLNIVTAPDDSTENLGALLSAHPTVAKVVLTGSCATGEKVMSAAAKTLKRLTLELGGNDAAIVLPDADPQAIAEGLFWGAFINNGQTCAALKRLYVHESILDEVCAALANFAKSIPVGDGMDERSVLGPIQNRQQFDKVSALVSAAKQHGKVWLGGAPGDALFYPPTIISGLSSGDSLVDEEQFGPVLPVIAYRDVEDAIAQANASPMGLGGSVWSGDIERAKDIATRLECGSVWINKHGMIQPNAPFGGVKKSGIGSEFAEEGLQEYTSIQVVFN